MNDANETDTPNARTDSRTTLTSSRRSVLCGIGAAGLSSALVGTAVAQRGRSNDGGASPASEEVPISTQFYTYRSTGLSTADLIREAADAGYDAFEPFRVGLDTDPEPILDAMDETGLEMGSAHASLDDALNRPDETADYFSQFGEPTLIHAYEGPGTWQSEDSIVEFAQTINEAADNMAERGLAFGYHNHDHEFVGIDGANELGFDIFAQEANDNVHLQLDAGWVHTGGANPLRYIGKYADNVDTIHMKNMADGEFVEIDEGDVNMKAVANAARSAADVDYLIYEHDAPADPLESMETGAEFLERWNGPPGRD